MRLSSRGRRGGWGCRMQLRIAVALVFVLGSVFLVWQLLGVHLISRDQHREAVSNLQHVQDTQPTTPFAIQKRVNLLLGSRLVDTSHYRPSKDGTFRCMLSLMEIAFEKVNDDFCDCPRDGSDEPGTSACSEMGRFFCTYHQRAGKPDVWVTSGRVNDGICDCCDGSDEWKNVSVPQRFKLSEADQRKFGVFQVPCPFTCF